MLRDHMPKIVGRLCIRRQWNLDVIRNRLAESVFVKLVDECFDSKTKILLIVVVRNHYELRPILKNMAIKQLSNCFNGKKMFELCFSRTVTDPQMRNSNSSFLDERILNSRDFELVGIVWAFLSQNAGT